MTYISGDSYKGAWKTDKVTSIYRYIYIVDSISDYIYTFDNINRSGMGVDYLLVLIMRANTMDFGKIMEDMERDSKGKYLALSFIMISSSFSY